MIKYLTVCVTWFCIAYTVTSLVIWSYIAYKGGRDDY